MGFPPVAGPLGLWPNDPGDTYRGPPENNAIVQWSGVAGDLDLGGWQSTAREFAGSRDAVRYAKGLCKPVPKAGGGSFPPSASESWDRVLGAFPPPPSEWTGNPAEDSQVHQGFVHIIQATKIVGTVLAIKDKVLQGVTRELWTLKVARG